MSAGLVVRAARAGDIDALVDVHIASWRVAYREQLPDTLLDGLDATRARRVALWNEILEDPKQPAFLAERDGTVVGFVHVGPARAPVPSRVGEVYAIYVDPIAWGTGVGRTLLARAETELRARGFRELILWVLGTNRRARHFYEAAGWRADRGTKRETVDGVTLDEVRYARELGPNPDRGAGRR